MDPADGQSAAAVGGSASFPIIAVAIIGILATAFLLVSYYVFVIKCCLTWHRIDMLARLSPRRPNPDPQPETGGLTEAAIRLIPITVFKKLPSGGGAAECAVCLNEFRDGQKLRAIPSCRHRFHIDCIDVWLQTSANCPLCRAAINPDLILTPILGNPQTNEDGFIVIEIGSPPRPNLTPSHDAEPERKRRKMQKAGQISSKGDECIAMNGQKDEQFAIQHPIRRSFSMDSAADSQLYFAVQEIIEKHRHKIINPVEICPNEGCSSSSRCKKSIFFPFGQGRASRNAVQPPSSDPN